MRIEEDCIGKLPIDEQALYGIHTVRAVRNFPISHEKLDPLIIQSLVQIKKAAAETNHAAGTLATDKQQAIVAACNDLLIGRHADSFIVPAIQGGAGTSANMNVNEVVANLAHRLKPAVKLQPNDDVNQSQSTNDTFPTAGKMALLQQLPGLLGAIGQLVQTLLVQAKAHEDTIKVGRTQLQDAVPTTYGRTFMAYYHLFKRDLARLQTAGDHLTVVNLGGTAIGTGVNATHYYQENILKVLNQNTKLALQSAPDLVDATQNCDGFVEFSGAMKTLAVNLSKFSNDLRLLASGPQSGLDELHLPAKQAGSSIMPGKVNPVIPEVVNQVCFEVIGNDVTVTMAAEAGQLELNAFEPIMLRDLLANERYLQQAMHTLVKNCLRDLTVNKTACAKSVEQSAITATVLTPYLGYVATTKLIKQAVAQHDSVKALLLKKQLLPATLVNQLFSPASLTQPRATKPTAMQSQA
ncbi:aspartate ammonia-lyase [Lactiplantibacillus sp. WILCCON 0030]|uniref:Aspartate ammonia-lyase n=1 Tax=Lactiplantibacillus brownii TaxID=3069269 RepID=A0ABU1A5J3_9LACO|nr:aspartate ammonia-lyase [Lactiplantibacillus brownii]MDQ7936250.1 aspartate ammonia-lyase [Lactiplantibacillus brownii]